MSPLAVITDKAAALLTIAAQSGIIVLAALFLARRASGPASQAANLIIGVIGRWGLVLAFLSALGATLISLFYSEIIGYPPCLLCWYQRVFMYPLAVILGIAVWRGDDSIIDYALTLAGLGALIALYHTSLQFGVQAVLPCSAAAVSCDRQYVMEFRYITIPVMSLTSFVLIMIFLAMKKFFGGLRAPVHY